MAVLNLRFVPASIGLATAVRILIPTALNNVEGKPDYDKLYGEKGETPVLWLLHGGSDNYADWHNCTNVQVLSDQYGYAVVMPDAQASSYTNMAYGPNWYDYVADELRNYIFDRFPFSRKREDNFISGMSMGGLGTLKLSLRHPERYSVAVPLASAVEVAQHYAYGEWDRVPGGPPQDGKPSAFNDIYGLDHNPGAILGSDEDCYALLKKNVEAGVTLPRLLHAQGLEDFTYKGNEEFVAYARSLGVQVEWYEDHGVHDWKSWNLFIPKVFEFIHKCRVEAGIEK